jgi:hypothetical protein
MTLITERHPPPNRVRRHHGEVERHLSEPAVMLTLAEWLFDEGAPEVCIHPDGMHIKSFDILAGQSRADGEPRRAGGGRRSHPRHRHGRARGGLELVDAHRPGRRRTGSPSGSPPRSWSASRGCSRGPPDGAQPHPSFLRSAKLTAGQQLDYGTCRHLGDLQASNPVGAPGFSAAC